MYKNSLEVIEQHNWTEGSKYLELVKLNIEQKKNETECYETLVEKYNLMKPKEFVSKWNRFQRIKKRIEWVK
tara:strand:+ start:625 stop:840 length:216 start_codon:yes stop_codon:yes gene_type:complete